MTYTANGKQVLKDGIHVADAVTEHGARRIAASLTAVEVAATMPSGGQITPGPTRDRFQLVQMSRLALAGDLPAVLRFAELVRKDK